MINITNLIRLGTVSSLNYPAGRVRVCFEDQDSIVTDELPMLSFEYEMPAVGEPVLCLFLGNGITRGFCLGRYFYPGDPWPADGTGKDIYFKRLMKDATIKYDRTSKTYTLTAEEIVFNGNLTINGNLKVSGNTDIGGNTSIGGNMDVGGSATIGVDATIGGISFKTHVHGGVASGSSKTAIPQAG